MLYQLSYASPTQPYRAPCKPHRNTRSSARAECAAGSNLAQSGQRATLQTADRPIDLAENLPATMIRLTSPPDRATTVCPNAVEVGQMLKIKLHIALIIASMVLPAASGQSCKQMVFFGNISSQEGFSRSFSPDLSFRLEAHEGQLGLGHLSRSGQHRPRLELSRHISHTYRRTAGARYGLREHCRR